MSSVGKGLTFALLGFVACGFITVNVQAEQGGAHGPAPFSDFDLDDSGFISEDEFNKVRSERMAEKAAEGKPMRGAASAPSFTDLDTDRDGQLNSAELTAGQKAHMEKRHGMSQGHDQGQGHGKDQGQTSNYGSGHGHGHGQGKNRKMPSYSDFDLNGDGKIVESEFNQAHAKRMSEMAAQGHQMKHAGDAPGFVGIDTDQDGEISEAEFSKHQSEHHKKQQEEKSKH